MSHHVLQDDMDLDDDRSDVASLVSIGPSIWDEDQPSHVMMSMYNPLPWRSTDEPSVLSDSDYSDTSTIRGEHRSRESTLNPDDDWSTIDNYGFVTRQGFPEAADHLLDPPFVAPRPPWRRVVARADTDVANNAADHHTITSLPVDDEIYNAIDTLYPFDYGSPTFTATQRADDIPPPEDGFMSPRSSMDRSIDTPDSSDAVNGHSEDGAGHQHSPARVGMRSSDDAAAAFAPSPINYPPFPSLYPNATSPGTTQSTEPLFNVDAEMAEAAGVSSPINYPPFPPLYPNATSPRTTQSTELPFPVDAEMLEAAEILLLFSRDARVFPPAPRDVMPPLNESTAEHDDASDRLNCTGIYAPQAASSPRCEPGVLPTAQSRSPPTTVYETTSEVNDASDRLNRMGIYAAGSPVLHSASESDSQSRSGNDFRCRGCHAALSYCHCPCDCCSRPTFVCQYWKRSSTRNE